MSLFRRVPGNLTIIFLCVFLTVWLYRPSHRFSHLDSSSLARYLNRSRTVQTLQSFAADLTPECDPVIQALTTTELVTTTEIQFVTQTCPAAAPKATAIPGQLPSKAAPLEFTTEQQIVARLRDHGIVVIFKTGAQEVAHLSIQVGTTLRYLDPADILFFSDLQGSLGPFLIHDALRNVDQTLKESDGDFEIYRAIRRYQRTGQDIEELKEERKKGDGRSGWRLDKYKFLHMVEETFEMRPDAKWYVFIETDSYVVWSNLAAWLSRLDSTRPMYLGAVVYIGDKAFGHGGSGYVLSNAAMNKLLGSDQQQGLAAAWDKRMKEICCGDLALGIALKEKGVDVAGARPLLNGDKPATFSFGPKNLWCQPVVTMHHVLPHEISAIWRYERRREILDANSNTTIFADLYYHFVEPLLVEERDNWDNMAQGKTYSAKENKKEEERYLEEERKKQAEMQMASAGESAQNEEERKKQEVEKKLEEEKVKAEEEKPRFNGQSEVDSKNAAEKAGLEKQILTGDDNSAHAGEPTSKGEDKEPENSDTEIDQGPPRTDGRPGSTRLEKGGPNEEKATAAKADASGTRDVASREEAEESIEKSTRSPEPASVPHGKRDERKRLTDVESTAHLSLENCARACEASEECFQYVFVEPESECTLGHSFRLGRYKAPAEGERVISKSGWKLKRIRSWTKNNPCEWADWAEWIGKYD
ncbi:hypothetical protein QTJ16_001461 [Diplocarpon rosae]|uniref:Glycosyltransferase family 31 protein n=1 Tax=Diplocarpon rosae TaxID=946125 RepID=A0AAD9T7G9_9HELO|nr:hypothetical protein QTJ16_001461 [Diplocarpon rosae]PBP22349.1 hypothetical protein BUE80_DR006912 [Diplocarpon rosae]